MTFTTVPSWRGFETQQTIDVEGTSVPPAQGEKTRDFWATQNGCNKTTTTSFTGCQSYSACVQPVIYCLGSWSHTIDAKAAGNIWSFFSELP